MVGKDHPEDTAQETEWNLAMAICMVRQGFSRSEGQKGVNWSLVNKLCLDSL